MASVVPLAVSAAYGWLGFIANGIAYSDLVGLPGQDEHMALLSRRAASGLALGAVCEAAAVTLFAWLLLPALAKRTRLGTAGAAGLIAVVLTFVAIKGV